MQKTQSNVKRLRLSVTFEDSERDWTQSLLVVSLQTSQLGLASPLGLIQKILQSTKCFPPSGTLLPKHLPSILEAIK